MAALVRADYSREQLETIKATVARGANDTQLALFLEVCKSRGLDPFVKQVYYTPQGVIVSIDGLRAIAERTGAYAPGPTRYEYGSEGQLVAAYVTVRKLVASTWHEVEESAYLEEYRGSSPIWRRMPRVMLAKCAESRALRRAFASDLSGLYSAEEMDQAQPERDITPAPVARPVVVEAQPGSMSEAYAEALEAVASANTADELRSAGARIRSLQGQMAQAEVEALRKHYAAKREEVA
jgi:phage recombination protein Bet